MTESIKNKEAEETLLKFPCTFTVKAMGLATKDFDALVVELVRCHYGDIKEGDVSCRPSKKGKYLAVSVTITATSKAQLDAIYQSLSDHPQVVMSL